MEPNTDTLFPDWLEQAKAKEKAADKAAKADQPKGQKCGNCAHHRVNPFSDKYHYCTQQTSKHTPNGYGKTTKTKWCDRWQEIRKS